MLAPARLRLHQSDAMQHGKMLGNLRLPPAELFRNGVDRSGAAPKQIHQFTPLGFRDRIKNIESRGCSSHDVIIFHYWNMSSGATPSVGEGTPASDHSSSPPGLRLTAAYDYGSSISPALAFVRTCSTDLHPGITAVTAGFFRHHASAH